MVPVDEIVARVPGAHIALLDPFLAADDVDDGVMAELREMFAELVPFAYVLGEPARFPDGEQYLPPQPVDRVPPDHAQPAPGLPRDGRSAPPRSTPSSPISRCPRSRVVPTPLEVHAREALLLVGRGDNETGAGDVPVRDLCCVSRGSAVTRCYGR